MLNRVPEIVVHDYTGIAPQPNGLAQVDTAALLPPSKGAGQFKARLRHYQPGDTCTHLPGPPNSLLFAGQSQTSDHTFITEHIGPGIQ